MTQFDAKETDAGTRADRFLAAPPELTRAQVQREMRAGRVSLTPAGGTPRALEDPAYRVKPGDVFTLTPPKPVPTAPQAENIALSIVYEDDALIVLDKPAGLVVHPAPGHRTGTLVNALLAHCGGIEGGSPERPGIVHRLDKDTSGLMLVAKTQAAYDGLKVQFSRDSGGIKRDYVGLVRGVPDAGGLVDAPIGRATRNRMKMAVRTGGLTAQTHYRVQRRFGTKAALVSCRLRTGRTHQIRVHLAHIGHPVLGDPLYGGRVHSRRLGLKLTRQALHAAGLSFEHPITGAACAFKSKPPDDFAQAVRRLGMINSSV